MTTYTCTTYLPVEADYVVSGGATHIVGLAAALYASHRRIPAKRVVGCSAGGYAGAALCMGIAPEKVQRVLDWILQKDRALDGNVFNLAKHFGYARGEMLREAAFKLVGDATLGETHIPLGVYVSDYNEPENGPVLLSSWTTPDVLVVDAVVPGGALPLAIQPQRIPSYTRGNRLFGDGGTGRNFPLDALDDHARPTIGIRVKPAKADPVTNAVRAWGWKAFIRSLVAQLMWASNHAHNTSKCAHHIIDVEATGDGLDFSLTPAEIDRRWKEGHDAGVAGATAARQKLWR